MGFQQLSLNASNLTATFVSNGAAVTVDVDEPLSRLFDGDFGIALGDCELQNSNAPFNLTYDFGAGNEQIVGDFGINFRTDGDARATAYNIQVSENGTDFTTIHTVTDNPAGGGLQRIYGVGGEPGFQVNPLKAYRYWRFNFTAFEDSGKTTILEIRAYTVSAIDLYNREYDVEFDDALLDLGGWKWPRYNGSSLKGAKINTFTKGDRSYGLNPVIENKTACIFLGKDVDTGDATNRDNVLVEILDHSYVTIDKILLIDLDTDDVEIIARENTNPKAFNRIVAENFPEGSTLIFKSLEKEANKLKTKHFVKFNQGQLMKLYSYIPNTEGIEDGVFGGFNIFEDKGKTDVAILSGSGIFGYGTTHIASRSLFNTSSLQFSTILPSELSDYTQDYATSTMGSQLVHISASSPPDFTINAQVGPGDFEYGYDGDDDAIIVEYSDIRLKENIIYVGKSKSKIPIYTFNYIGRKERYIGTMAQDLIKLGRTDAVKLNNNGYYSVYYNKIDINFNII